MKELNHVNAKFEAIDERLIQQKKYNERKNEEYNKTLDLKLQEFENKIETKLANFSSQITEEVPNKVNKTLEKLPQPHENNFREIIQEAQEKEILMMEDKKVREQNMILFRSAESKDPDPEIRKAHDSDYFRELCESVLDVGRIGTKQIIRLGKKSENSNRPLRITLANPADKNNIMANANMLKNADEKFRNISISYDYTKEEREKIKASVAAAKELTKNDPNFSYRVTGHPWNLYTRKIPKK